MQDDEDEIALITMIRDLIDPDGEYFNIIHKRDTKMGTSTEFNVWLTHKDENLFIDIRDGHICINSDGDEAVMINISTPGGITKEILDEALREYLLKPFNDLVAKVDILKDFMDSVISEKWQELARKYNYNLEQQAEKLSEDSDKFIEAFKKMYYAGEL